MRATYHKLNNVIVVQLTEEERIEYMKLGLSVEDLTSTDNDWELTIPCSATFYLATQRARGGEQTWDQEQLRDAIRASVANKLVPYNRELAPNEFSVYSQEHSKVREALGRNIRLMFPSAKHPRAPLFPDEAKFRKKWRREHGLR